LPSGTPWSLGSPGICINFIFTMPFFRLRYLHFFLSLTLLVTAQSALAQQTVSRQPSSQKQDSVINQFNNRFGKNDTIWSQVIIYNGDTIPAKTYAAVDVYYTMTRAMRRRWEAMTRLRNAVYVTYPYARKAGIILNDMNVHLANMNSESEKKDYIRSMEKEVRRAVVHSVAKATIRPSVRTRSAIPRPVTARASPAASQP
jgi:hypothetical protein